MTAQVIFLNRWLDCPKEKIREHEMIQVLLSEKWAEFEHETRNYTPFQKMISRQKSYDLQRSRMRVISNEDDRKAEELSDIDE